MGKIRRDEEEEKKLAASLSHIAAKVKEKITKEKIGVKHIVMYHVTVLTWIEMITEEKLLI